ncbi:PROTEIN LOW PSII ACCUMULATION 1 CHLOROPLASTIC [Salix purpurea]|uniref:PROTEIN LOW PSII ACCUMULATION 1 CHLOROPLASTIC n=1 Tax=Salix purpurea TaxID=77065 RepID=A0A9Q0ZRI6_SALPP|nr:PROTEIN LOW PSII ACCUMULATION 1 CHLOROPLASTIC [Salix purpurea]
MSSAVVAGTTSTSCFPTFSKNQSLKTTSTKSFISSHHQKTSFQGLSLQDGRRGCSDFFMPHNNCSNLINGRTGLQVTARTAGAAKTIEVEVDKPLGLTLGQKSGGGVVITGVEGGGNAAKAGLKAGDQVLYTSSFFGDELWPADKLGFTKTAIQAKPDSIYFVVSRCAVVGRQTTAKAPRSSPLWKEVDRDSKG